jgi:hypothetical protein
MITNGDINQALILNNLMMEHTPHDFASIIENVRSQITNDIHQHQSLPLNISSSITTNQNPNSSSSISLLEKLLGFIFYFYFIFFICVCLFHLLCSGTSLIINK